MSPDKCWEYHDMTGPHETYEKCSARAYEMGNDIGMINRGNIMPKSFKCVPLKGTSL
jgi:hypothetical protein